jgi:hypothetical protein
MVIKYLFPIRAVDMCATLCLLLKRALVRHDALEMGC